MDCEHFGNGSKGDRIFGSSSFYFVGSVLAVGFFCFWLAQNFSTEFASFAAGSAGNGTHWRGGVFVHLKMFVLSGAAIALWLTPLVALDKKVSWHKAIQGLSLGGAVACAVGAGNIARRLAEENEIELIKIRAITADVVDEIATSAYVSQAQRQQEAEQILSGQSTEREETVESLKRAWLLDCAEPASEETEPTESQVQAVNLPEDKALTIEEETFTSLNLTRNQAIELIKKMRLELNLNQKDIIEKLWACTKGGSNDWKKARAQFKKLTGE